LYSEPPEALIQPASVWLSLIGLISFLAFALAAALGLQNWPGARLFALILNEPEPGHPVALVIASET